MDSFIKVFKLELLGHLLEWEFTLFMEIHEEGNELGSGCVVNTRKGLPTKVPTHLWGIRTAF